jgi:hypothetical protein
MIRLNSGWGVGLVILLLAAGCVSTPQSRIQKEPQLFASFPPEGGFYPGHGSSGPGAAPTRPHPGDGIGRSRYLDLYGIPVCEHVCANGHRILVS